MDTFADHPLLWSPRKWGYAITASLVIQLGLLFYLGERFKALPHHEGFGTAIHLASDPAYLERLNELPTLTDPTLFALPSPQGFSGHAWLSFAPMKYEPPDWTEAPRWLEPPTQALAQVLADFVSNSIPPPLLVADKPLPRLIAAGTSVLPVPVRSRSEYRREGDLAQRRLAEPLEIPPWPHTDMLSNSVVQMLVDAEGRTLAATLLSPGSGSAAADQAAVQMATHLRFDPVPRPTGPRQPTVSSGRMVFRWATIPLTATNNPGSRL
jgi:hypothetical protein